MVEFANIVDQFENTLGRPFERADILKSPLTLKEISCLARESRQPHQLKTIPEKASEHQVRPFIDPQFNMGIMDYALKGNTSSSYERYVFDKAIAGRMTSSIKQLLLYSHAVVINDPLAYLFDFFYGETGDNPPEWITGRIEAINSLLVDYSDLAPLIRERVVIPVEFFAGSGGSTLYPTSESTAELTSTLGRFIPSKELARLEHEVYKTISTYNSLAGQADFFFPEQNHVQVLKEVLRAANKRFVSSEIQSQLNMALLTQLRMINVDSLSPRDIVNIRQNEEIFDRWRSYLSDALKLTVENASNASSIDDEFCATIRDHLQANNNETLRKLREGRWSADIKPSAFNIGVGALAGSIATFDTTGVIAGAADPLLRALHKVIAAMRDRNGEIALRSHFVAVGVDRSNG